MSATIEAVTQNKNDIPWNKHVRQKQKPGDLAVSGVINVLLLLTIVAVLYPLWFVVIASFSNPNAVAGGEVLLLPKGVTFAGYAKVFANQRIWQGYLNTIIYSVVGTAVNMAVTIPCAFALSRREFKPRRVIMFLFTVTMFIAGGLIPNYLLYKSLGINNSMWVFILPGAVSVYNVIVARSFFETSIPEEHLRCGPDRRAELFWLLLQDCAAVELCDSGCNWSVLLCRPLERLHDGPYLHHRRQEAAIAGGVAAVAAGGAGDWNQCQRGCAAAGRRSDQVRHHHRLYPASACALSVLAEVLQQGCDARRGQGLSQTQSDKRQPI